MNTLRPQRGFTLLELLVAATITLGIAALMVSVTTSMLGLWRRSQSANTQAAAARQVFDWLEQDLQSAVCRRDDACWLAVDILDSPSGLANHGWLLGSGVMKPAAGESFRPLPPAESPGGPLLADARFGLGGAWLRFVATNIEAGGALPVVVAYQVARRPVTGDPTASNRAPVRYALYRTAVGTGETLAAGYDVTATVYASADNSPFAALSSAYRTPRNVMNPSHANLLSSNVVDFGVWMYVRKPDGSLQIIFPAGAADGSHHAVGNSASLDARFPEVIDVMVRILSDEGVAQVEAIETGRISSRPPLCGSDAEWWWRVVEAHSRVFVRRIEVKAVPL